METMPRLRSIDTSPSARRSTTSASSRDASSIVTDTLTSDVATTSTDVRCRSNTSNSVRMNPSVSSMRGLRTFTSVTPLFPAIARHRATRRVEGDERARAFRAAAS